MNTYKVKAYFNGLIRMQAEAKGMKQYTINNRYMKKRIHKLFKNKH